MKKLTPIVLMILSLVAIPVWAQNSVGESPRDVQDLVHARVIRSQISGSAIPLANPLVGAFPLLANYDGSGTFGGVSGQGMYLYAQLNFGSNGKTALRLLEGQMSFRMQINGEVLLAVFDSGETGWLQITDPATGSAVWEQNWTGTIFGGTGQFSGAKGTVKKSAKGFAVFFKAPGQPASAVLQPWSGTLEIQVEQ